MSRGKSLEQQMREVSELSLGDLQRRYRQLWAAEPPKLARPALETLVRFQLQKLLIAYLQSRLFQVLSATEAIQSLVAEDSSNTILLNRRNGKCRVVRLVDDGSMCSRQRPTYPRNSSASDGKRNKRSVRSRSA